MKVVTCAYHFSGITLNSMQRPSLRKRLCASPKVPAKIRICHEKLYHEDPLQHQNMRNGPKERAVYACRMTATSLMPLHSMYPLEAVSWCSRVKPRRVNTRRSDVGSTRFQTPKTQIKCLCRLKLVEHETHPKACPLAWRAASVAGSLSGFLAWTPAKVETIWLESERSATLGPSAGSHSNPKY